jgi:cell division protein FtsZ
LNPRILFFNLLNFKGGGGMFELEESRISGANLKVVGIGGGGCNAVNTMIQSSLNGVEFIGANTDAQALSACRAPMKIQLGAKLTKWLGAGANPEIGKNATLEDQDRIREILTGADMVFITAGLGGGTGTGGGPILASIAREVGALTVAVVTKPFLFEGKKRQRQAEEGLKELRKYVDTLITIPNQRLLNIAGKDMCLLETFRKADEVLLQAVKGISDLITVHGLINLDFADVRTVMSEMGLALMGTGCAEGENRAIEAAQRAISSPLLEDITIAGARGILINITGGPDLTLYEVNEASTLVQEEAHEDANIIFGAVIDENLRNEMRVTVIATGFGKAEELEERIPESRAASPEPEKTVVNFNRKESNRDIPTFMRQEKSPEVQEKPIRFSRGRTLSPLGEDEYDIPTFLRKQAD